MLDDLAGKSTGARIQIIRQRRGMTRETLAGLVGRSAEWLKAVERGRLKEPRLSMLVKLAEVLGIADLAELTGERRPLPVTSFHRIPHEAVPAIREAIHTHQLTAPQTEVDLAALRARVDAAWQRWHASTRQRTEVGRILPALITDARTAIRVTDGTDRREAHAILADVYNLCEQMLAWASEPELLWLVSDRGIASAQEADRPESIATAAWLLGNVRRSVGDFEGAMDVVSDAMGVLRPRLEDGPDDLRGLWGSLHLHAAITAARAGRDGDAWAYWAEGDAAAERLGAGYCHPHTVFSAGNVAVHAVSVGVDLSKSGEAHERAKSLDPDMVPSRERRARLLVEIARSYGLDRDWAGVVNYLTRACEVSVESVYYTPLARSLAVDALDSGGPLVEKDARALARRLGIPR